MFCIWYIKPNVKKNLNDATWLAVPEVWFGPVFPCRTSYRDLIVDAGALRTSYSVANIFAHFYFPVEYIGKWNKNENPADESNIEAVCSPSWRTQKRLRSFQTMPVHF